MPILYRLVRMTFRPDEVPAFLDLFAESAPKIRAFAGCEHLELWQDPQYPNILTTFSRWRDAKALEAYRESPLFRETWRATRQLFAAPPSAHSHYPAAVEGVPVPEAGAPPITP